MSGKRDDAIWVEPVQRDDAAAIRVMLENGSLRVTDRKVSDGLPKQC